MDVKITHDKRGKDSSLKKEKLRKLGMRGSIIVLRDAGHKMESISSILNCTRQTISKWLKRYNKDGIAGLEDLPRSGRRRKLNSKEIIRIENSNRKFHCFFIRN